MDVATPDHVLMEVWKDGAAFVSKEASDTQEKATAPSEVLARPDSDCLLFDLSIKTDAFGQETSWEIVDTKNSSVVLSNSSLPSNQIVQDSECLDSKGCYEFVIRDTFNDGICCGAGNGDYNVSINSKVVGSGGQFGSYETTFLGGNCGIDAS